MSETDTNAQTQKPKTSKLAVTSLVFGLLGPIVYFALTTEWFYELSLKEPLGVLGTISGLLCFFAGLMGILCAIASSGQIKNSQGHLVGRWYANMGFVISLLWTLFVFLVAPEPDRRFRVEGVKRMVCASNLKGLGMALMLYANDYDDEYPTADKWCDLLIQYVDMSPKQFICKGSDSREGESSYALNKNVVDKKASEIPPDVVLLFETKGGWNQYGGPEILTFENHKGKGCNVLFNNCHVVFIKPEQLEELKWQVEQSKQGE
jgi:hypothetical protein